VVGEASNGVEALEKFKILLPDIVITDIHMDEMNGLEFAEKARQEKPDVKVIILSGYDQFEYAKKAIEIKVFSYILKPVLPEELVEIVQKLIFEMEEDRRIRLRLDSLEEELKSRLIPADSEFIKIADEKSDEKLDITGENREHVKSVIKKAQDYILNNFAKLDISLILIAEYVYLNPAYFSKLYKKATGESYVDYITRLRIKEAKRLLKESNIKIGDIGARVGYPNTQYFCTLFKRIVGLSPVEYRET
jgi:two-component system, response regulator YesN